MSIPASFYEEMDRSVSYQKQMGRVQLVRGEYPYAFPRNVREFREAKARYWGLITLVDEMVGRVLRRVSELGLGDNTIIVFTSDHGEMMGDHRMMSKIVEYEEAAKTPCLLRMPGQQKQMIIERRVAQVDLAPTLLELMGQPAPAHLQGRSWAPYLRSGAWWPSRDVSIEFLMFPTVDVRHPLHGRTLVTQEGWKLSLSEVGGGELYNLSADPQEMVNLFPRPEYRTRVEELAGRLKRWQASTGDRVTLNPRSTSQWPVEWIDTLRRMNIDFDRDLNKCWPETGPSRR